MVVPVMGRYWCVTRFAQLEITERHMNRSQLPPFVQLGCGYVTKQWHAAADE